MVRVGREREAQGELLLLLLLLLEVKWGRRQDFIRRVERWAENKRVVGTVLRIEVAVDNLQGRTKRIKIHFPGIGRRGLFSSCKSPQLSGYASWEGGRMLVAAEESSRGEREREEGILSHQNFHGRGRQTEPARTNVLMPLKGKDCYLLL